MRLGSGGQDMILLKIFIYIWLYLGYNKNDLESVSALPKPYQKRKVGFGMAKRYYPINEVILQEHPQTKIFKDFKVIAGLAMILEQIFLI